MFNHLKRNMKQNYYRDLLNKYKTWHMKNMEYYENNNIIKKQWQIKYLLYF